MSQREECPDCEGDGEIDCPCCGMPLICPVCQGAGTVEWWEPEEVPANDVDDHEPPRHKGAKEYFELRSAFVAWCLGGWLLLFRKSPVIV